MIDLNKSNLKKIISDFSKAKLLVLGDLILDEYLLGFPERISREAPVIILEYINSDYALGGASNAASNAADLGAQVTLMGLTGKDLAASQIYKLCRDKSINLVEIQDESRLTTVKTRIISSSNSSPDNGTVVKQQVLRLDKLSREAVSDSVSDRIYSEYANVISDHDVILFSDYSNGLFREDLTKNLLGLAHKKNKKVIVDSTGNFSKFRGAYSITPNQPDAEKMLNYKLKNDLDLERAALDLFSLLNTQKILLTRGAKGMALFSKDTARPNLIPAFNLSEVFDVTGAGDTVAASYVLGLAVGATDYEAALIGNLAASLVVKKYGTATTNPEELRSALEALSKDLTNYN
jgi:D-glycero-beta-D-manno-heptose-7-phosphate kinase